MSKGFGGYAHLTQEDNSVLCYSYCSYNINFDNWKAMHAKEDGILQIKKKHSFL